MPTRTLLLALAVPLAFACSRESRRPSEPARPVTDARLRAAPAAGDGWLTYGYDWGNRRSVPLTGINRETVHGLMDGAR